MGSDCGQIALRPLSSWKCWAGTQSLNPGIAANNALSQGHYAVHSLIFTNHTSCWSDLLSGDLRWWFFNSQLSALFCSYFSITAAQRQLMTHTVRVGHNFHNYGSGNHQNTPELKQFKFRLSDFKVWTEVYGKLTNHDFFFNIKFNTIVILLLLIIIYILLHLAASYTFQYVKIFPVAFVYSIVIKTPHHWKQSMSLYYL